MSGKIYLVGNEGELLKMEESPYEAEALLQILLAEYPDLLAGDQMRPTAPRRWLLISRELSVPGDETEKGRWSLDHLFIDQEGIPTLVEVKRSSNTQIRREVVGQMLDYAANGTLYWSLDQITSAFERRCERDGADPDAVIADLLRDEAESDPAEFWQSVKTNLQAGRVRLVFVADQIPQELRRIIEFLNDQMDPAEVLGVEVPQFVGEGRQALVPRVVGMTAEAERRKTVGTITSRRWDEESFFEELTRQRPSIEVEAAQRLLNWARANGLEVRWGSGSKNGSFSPKARIDNDIAHLFAVYTDFNIQFAFAAMNVPPFDQLEGRRELANRLRSVVAGLEFGDDKLEAWPFSGRGTVTTGNVEAFLEVWDWFLAQLYERRRADL